MHFSGSYAPEDVTFLLKRIQMAPTEIAEKERLIQSGARHYSEMISREPLPSAEYLAIFRDSLARNGQRMAADIYALAAYLARQRPAGITLVSLARAGTPIGVLVRRALKLHFGLEVAHYSVSIIRDRGIDEVALRHILDQGHAPESLVFLDGWTGKGVISRELASSIADFNRRYQVNIDAGLYVLSDLAGTAAYAASGEDYLIPSSILNGIVSGLISRSILNRDYIGPDDFHGCVYFEELEPHDLSRHFVDVIHNHLASLPSTGLPAGQDVGQGHRLYTSQTFMERMQSIFEITDPNLIKPGIGESTRVMLRRVPDLLLLKNHHHADVQHLLVLAREKQVEVCVDPLLPYNAAALIQEA